MVNKVLKFHCTQEQYNALSGLAYRIADNQYMIERYGADGSEIERQQNHKTIIGLFDELDKMRVPFWVQNAVICWSENWRQYKSDCLISAFNKYMDLPGFDVSFSGVSCL